MGGTAVIGLSGLAILGITARALGADDYAAFGVFWSAVFFVVALIFGAQQESTRSVAQRRQSTGGTSLVTFAIALGSLAATVLLVTAPAWRPPALDGHVWAVVAVAAGGLLYTLTGVLAGVLAGAGLWNGYAGMLIAEGASRFALVLLAIAVASGVTPLAWAVVAAYPVALLVGGVALRRHRVGFRVDDSIATLVGNTVKTMTAAAAVAALVNGFPLIMSMFARGASDESVGALTLAIMLTRAPLLVPLMALQGLLIKRFSDATRPIARSLIQIVLACVLGAGLLGLAAGAIGPGLLRSFFGPEFELSSTTLALLVLSSGLIGALSVTAPALVARNRHGLNVVGWAAAVVVSVGLLALSPGGLDVRAPVALLAGPAVGLVIHLTMVGRLDRPAAARSE
jgi:O-antigen/teichoic acid export membrane protein